MPLILNFTIAANAARLIRKQLRFGLGSRRKPHAPPSILGSYFQIARLVLSSCVDEDGQDAKQCDRKTQVFQHVTARASLFFEPKQTRQAGAAILSGPAWSTVSFCSYFLLLLFVPFDFSEGLPFCSTSNGFGEFFGYAAAALAQLSMGVLLAGIGLGRIRISAA